MVTPPGRRKITMLPCVNQNESKKKATICFVSATASRLCTSALGRNPSTTDQARSVLNAYTRVCTWVFFEEIASIFKLEILLL